MITLQLKNKHLYFALESIWNDLDYRFKYQINQLAMANDDDEYEQKIEVNRETIAKIIQSVNLKPQGISREINPEMFIAVQTQIQALVQQGNEEAIEIAQDMASPKKSLMIYVTDTNGTFTSAGWWGYNGTTWKLILAE